MPQPAASRQPERAAAQLARYGALCEVLPLAVAVFDHRARLAQSNARFRELVGLAVDDDGVAAEAVFASALADLAPAVAAVARDGSGRTLRVAFPARAIAAAGGAPGGAPAARLIDIALVPLLADDGLGCAFLGTDVTERERLREQAQRSAKALETIFDLIPEAIRVCDAEGRVLRANALAGRPDLGGTVESMRDVWRAFEPHDAEGVPIAFEDTPSQRALRGETVAAVTMHVTHAGRPRVIEVSAIPMRGPDGQVVGAVSVTRDVTERVQLAQELEEQVRIGNALVERVTSEAERLERMVDERTRQLVSLQEARARQQRLAAIGQLAAGVMHDVNNALNPIMAAAHLVRLHAADEGRVRENAARIATAAETGAALTARLARFIRQTPRSDPAEHPVDLAALCEEVATMMQPLWEGRAHAVALALETVPGVVVSGVAGELRAAVMNLVQNAVDAMPDGGLLRLTTRATRTAAILEVRDTGRGMPPEVVERAFEPFYTTKGAAGTGLGLAEVYGVARRHRGQAAIESAPGAGTLVRLTFPLAPEGAGSAPAAPGDRRQALVLEREGDGRAFLVAALASAGHAAEAVASLAAAAARLDEAAAAGGTPAVLVVDAGVAEGEGAALRALRRRHGSLRTILVAEAEGAPAPGLGDAVVHRPVRAGDLLSLVSRLH